MIERHKVIIFYTAPTAIRSLIKAAQADPDTHPQRYDLSSLRLLGSVGEPINPEAWIWYYNNVGNGRCPIVDTWWQTETGGHILTPLPGATPLKPGSRSEEHTSELQSLMRISYAVFCLKNKRTKTPTNIE